MNFQFYLEKLHSSDVFKKFKRENPKSYLCSSFFIFDFRREGNKQHFDFYAPEEKKIFSFQIEENFKIVPIEQIKKEIPEKISLNLNFDFDEIKRIILNKIEEEKIKNKIEEMMLSLQRVGKINLLIGTIFVSGLGLIKLTVDLSKKEIIEFEKKSFFDMMKIFRK
ncbi:MAG: hypothetical protein ABH804_03165 [archaeon]